MQLKGIAIDDQHDSFIFPRFFRKINDAPFNCVLNCWSHCLGTKIITFAYYDADLLNL
jgi:hypothetical protein